MRGKLTCGMLGLVILGCFFLGVLAGLSGDVVRSQMQLTQASLSLPEKTIESPTTPPQSGPVPPVTPESPKYGGLVAILPGPSDVPPYLVKSNNLDSFRSSVTAKFKRFGIDEMEVIEYNVQRTTEDCVSWCYVIGYGIRFSSIEGAKNAFLENVPPDALPYPYVAAVCGSFDLPPYGELIETHGLGEQAAAVKCLTYGAKYLAYDWQTNGFLLSIVVGGFPPNVSEEEVKDLVMKMQERALRNPPPRGNERQTMLLQ